MLISSFLSIIDRQWVSLLITDIHLILGRNILAGRNLLNV